VLCERAHQTDSPGSPGDTWPPDERDALDILARTLATEHTNVQIALLEFSLAADRGEPIDDDIYMQLLASLARLSLVGSELRLALLSYRTTSRLPVVEAR
jgi:hypothetical protein